MDIDRYTAKVDRIIEDLEMSLEELRAIQARFVEEYEDETATEEDA